jgi:hypothetical protein
MDGKTLEQRREIAQRSLATRRANKAARDEKIDDLGKEMWQLISQIKIYQHKLAELKLKMHITERVAPLLADPFQLLLREDEIVERAAQTKRQLTSGVYFLVSEGRVVYVGQSLNVHKRITEHKSLTFDCYTWIPCKAEALNKVESLYIHLLRPPGNAISRSGGMCAPISLSDLFPELREDWASILQGLPP